MRDRITAVLVAFGIFGWGVFVGNAIKPDAPKVIERHTYTEYQIEAPADCYATIWGSMDGENYIDITKGALVHGDGLNGAGELSMDSFGPGQAATFENLHIKNLRVTLSKRGNHGL